MFFNIERSLQMILNFKCDHLKEHRIFMVGYCNLFCMVNITTQYNKFEMLPHSIINDISHDSVMFLTGYNQ